ncbi:response regulator transcription factor [Paenibacillus alginolyticus]|uniref:response regulator transcription factor n=1 Tax=Paenibacillus alginolyticus TaxID=59839 RepID=UPI0004082E05|nr:response regulator transcription factor [Paenibacillus alginolyticus]MCY9666491.1 response regulator transcription factor [Paenibacillus alginolyticus]
MIQIGIAEDQALIRESLAIVLGLESDIEVRWTAATGSEALSKLKESPVDIILMDLRMPQMEGVTAMKHIQKDERIIEKPTIIVLTTFHHDEWLIEALGSGAEACFLKEIPPHLLTRALREIIADEWNPALWGGDWRKYVPEIQFSIRRKENLIETGHEYLTTRDLDILRKLCAGATNGEIAAVLHLSEGTIKNYVSSLYGKLGVRHRAEAVKLAHEKGIIATLY